MFKFLSKNSSENESAPHYAMPEDEIVYAIGDVHGCLISMLNLLDKIEVDRRARPESKCTVVFLGDLVDRGPSSKQVLDYLIDYQPDWTEVAYLRGNHEEVMLDVLCGNLSAMRSWFGFGGKACARSYGVDNFGQMHVNPNHIMMSLQRSVPKEHLVFMSSFPDAYAFGDYLLVHAGIKPRVAIEDQSPYDMRWIRSSFLEYKKPHPVKVVHGHTVVDDEPENHSNRIAVDTGAHKGRPLTAVCLCGGEEIFIQSDPIGI